MSNIKRSFSLLVTDLSQLLWAVQSVEMLNLKFGFLVQQTKTATTTKIWKIENKEKCEIQNKYQIIICLVYTQVCLFCFLTFTHHLWQTQPTILVNAILSAAKPISVSKANNMKALRVFNWVQRHYIKYQSTSPSANLSVHFPLNVATGMSLQLGVVADGSVVPTDVTISTPAVEFVSFHLKSTLFLSSAQEHSQQQIFSSLQLLVFRTVI